jgi:hypothetical protein
MQLVVEAVLHLTARPLCRLCARRSKCARCRSFDQHMCCQHSSAVAGTPPQYTEIYICSKPLGAVEWHSTRPRLVANTCVGNTCVANTCVANTGQVAHVDVLIHADLVDAYDMY